VFKYFGNCVTTKKRKTTLLLLKRRAAEIGLPWYTFSLEEKRNTNRHYVEFLMDDSARAFNQGGSNDTTRDLHSM
jgi:hypothetical protein